MPLRLVAVLAHECDEPGEGAATLARYAAVSHEVMVVTFTQATPCGGMNGDIDAVTEVLGVGHHRLCHPTAGHPPVPAAEPTEQLVRVLREFRPHVVVVHDDATTSDPDRERCRAATLAAFDAAGERDLFPAAGEAWQPYKLYHAHEWHEPRMRALHDALLEEGLASPYGKWLAEPVGGAERITTRVDCADYFPVRHEVLRTHAAQLDPDHHWFAVPARVRQAAWPTEDFELTRSHVPTTLPEDDLFAGLGPGR